MFNCGVCTSCKKSRYIQGRAIGCILSECKYEPMETNYASFTTSPYVPGSLSENARLKREVIGMHVLKDDASIILRNTN